MFMKKFFLSILSILLLFFTFSIPISADSGPKPSLTIHFEGIDEPYYVTVLGSIERYGPHGVESDEFYIGHENEDLLIKFNQFEDDYYFWGNVEECTTTHKFKWGYWPPETFKVLVYFPNSDTFVVSDIYERYAFRSYYTFEFNDHEIIDGYKSYNYTFEIISFVSRCLLTICLELFIAELFDLKNSKQRSIIIRTNLITQILLNLFIAYTTYTSGYSAYIFTYLWLEVLVFIVEGFIYSKTLPKTTDEKIQPWKYALFANIFSFITGSIVQSILNSISNINLLI